MFHFEATLHLSGGIRSQAWAKPPQRYKLPATRSRNSHVGWSPFRPRLHRTNATWRMKVANYWKKMYIIGWISIVMWILTRRDIYRLCEWYSICVLIRTDKFENCRALCTHKPFLHWHATHVPPIPRCPWSELEPNAWISISCAHTKSWSQPYQSASQRPDNSEQSRQSAFHGFLTWGYERQKWACAERENPANFSTKETKLKLSIRNEKIPRIIPTKKYLVGKKTLPSLPVATFRAWICAGIPVIKPTSLGVFDIWAPQFLGASGFPHEKIFRKISPSQNQWFFFSVESCFFSIFGIVQKKFNYACHPDILPCFILLWFAQLKAKKKGKKKDQHNWHRSSPRSLPPPLTRTPRCHCLRDYQPKQSTEKGENPSKLPCICIVCMISRKLGNLVFPGVLLLFLPQSWKTKTCSRENYLVTYPHLGKRKLSKIHWEGIC